MRYRQVLQPIDMIYMEMVDDAELQLSGVSPQRFYSMSAEIRLEREDYYATLERTQKGDLDITDWILWFLACLDRAIAGPEWILANVLRKAAFWRAIATQPLNDRQHAMTNHLLEGFEGKLTSSKWAKLTKVSPDTALRDIPDLITRDILMKDDGGWRSTSYSLKSEDLGS